ncbi:MAG: homoserine O-succinyltransferase [Oscillospiraceae bacterium]|jgi:homoserine O-succinyltransferase|nr:homoserine O-succinyltransferase [Oscillospiraceae bacterium]
MPIRINPALPARSILESENIFVMGSDRADHQDIRPLEVLILNIMPTKLETETQLLRLLSNSPLQVNVHLMHMASHESKNTDKQHLLDFYRTFEELHEQRFDGMIITGAPVETLPFEEVDYWHELCQIFCWSRRHVYSTLHICWGAQAGLYFHYGVPKYPIPQKMSGVFEHRILQPSHPLLRGMDDRFPAPHSRHTEIRRADIEAVPGLQLLTLSDVAGVHIVSDTANRNVYVTGHSEYDRGTLAKEYFRDINKGMDVPVPANYFPDDDPARTPIMRWRGAATLLFSNWLNYSVYQKTYYDLSMLDKAPAVYSNSGHFACG